MIQKIVITDYANDVNQWLDKGWAVVSVIAQFVGGNNPQLGKFAFLLTKTVSNSNDFTNG